MPTLLIKNAACLATMDDDRRILHDAGVYIENGIIRQIDAAGKLPAEADQVIDAAGHIVLPGFINTHHHMFQTLTRAVPAVQNAELFNWLKGLYPIWTNLTPEMVKVSAQIAMAELLLSGCTTSSDHLYIYPNGVTLEDTIEAAQIMGMRFTATRGSMSVGQSKGGLPPDQLVEPEDQILNDTRRVIERWHDGSFGSRLHIGVAPCSPFSVSQALMRESATLARSYGVRLHTHLAENDHDIHYTRETFGKTPAEYATDLGWLGSDVWHAHCVKLDDAGIRRFAASGTGVAHCPCSNMRLASGIAPIRNMLNAGVPVGLGVDGSASNDGGNLTAEIRTAMLLARVGKALDQPVTRSDGKTDFGCDLGPKEMSAYDALFMATRGGAEVLGRSDTGRLAVGMCGDIAIFDLQSLPFAGAGHDPLGALVFCTGYAAAYTVVHGDIIVKKGVLQTVDLPQVIRLQNQLAAELLQSM